MKDFKDITEKELRILWKEHPDSIIAEMYGVTKEEGTQKRKEFHINPETDRFYDVINGELVYNKEYIEWFRKECLKRQEEEE